MLVTNDVINLLQEFKNILLLKYSIDIDCLFTKSFGGTNVIVLSSIFNIELYSIGDLTQVILVNLNDVKKPILVFNGKHNFSEELKKVLQHT